MKRSGTHQKSKSPRRSKGAPKESVLQAFVVSLVESRRLQQNISGKTELDVLLKGLMDPQFLPAFPIDYLARQRSIMAAARVMSALENCSLVSAAPQNIALLRKRRRGGMLPDLVICDDSHSEFSIIEIKRSNQTEREAITELWAMSMSCEIICHFYRTRTFPMS
jgi:hypothetical protein